MSITVVFPAPLGPSSPNTSFLPISRFTLSTARRFSYFFVRLRIFINYISWYADDIIFWMVLSGLDFGIRLKWQKFAKVSHRRPEAFTEMNTFLERKPNIYRSQDLHKAEGRED